MSKYHFIASLLICFILVSCGSDNSSDNQGSWKSNSEIKDVEMDHIPVDSMIILKHLRSLSSDGFQGRKPCTQGGLRTVAYLTNELKKLGIKPGNKGSYVQEVPLLDIIGYPSDTMKITQESGSYEFKNLDDYVIHSQRKADVVGFEDSELVFCGYGIVAPELGWNDFEGMDMKGKTAVVLINDPDFGVETDEPTLFKGETMTYYGRWTYKYEEADRQGADGVLMIHETASAGYQWFVVQSSWSGSQQGLSGIDRSNDCGVKGWISLAAAKRLFDEAGLDIGKEIRSARKKGFKAKSLKAKASVSIDNQYTECISRNVVGIIEGSKYPDEYVVYTTHWDHLGIGTAVEGDSIYNGAMDNASGCATLLGIAEAFKNADKAPERSVVFLFVTAEEQGLLGSEYYVERPLFPLEQTICNINIDGVNPAGPMKDLTITGLGHSQMDEIAEFEAKKQGRYVIGEQEPEKGYFFRSDHFNFVKKGIPVLYAKGGSDHKLLGKPYAEDFKKTYLEARYHAPSDEFDVKNWRFEGVLEDAQLNFNVGNRMANTRDKPGWKKGSEFGEK